MSMAIQSKQGEIILSQFADDPDMAELIEEYVDSIAETSISIKQKLEERAFEDLGRLAHQLKGSGGGYGFPAITDAARVVETKVKSEAELTAIQHSVDELLSILSMVKKAG